MRKVAAVVQDGVEPFGLGAMCEVWAEPYHPEDDNPVFDFVVCTPRPGRVRSVSGFDLHVDHGLDAADDADLVIIVPKRDFQEPSPEVAAVAAAAHERGAWVLGHCTAAFTLGEAGLLDGRRCTTHWRHSGELEAAYPRAQVDCNVLYVQDGRVITGAGSAAGLDAALHLMREEFGASVAAKAARRMVVPAHREGGQAQFIARAVPDLEADTLGSLLTWIVEHLAEDLSVEALARRQHMSPRTFARRFRDETGTTPHAWVTAHRVAAAEELLESTDRSVEWIASEVGFGNAATLRQHFTRSRGVSPQRYRRIFARHEGQAVEHTA
ncbi:helix-turn-helix domain-containing protein [Ornithinimicrobium faecis]|uniref:Helix-turn-helix domain-containing protein n=1 Tax=Ornithinimicrobium faecis TaxID=2934158 RepID=A0ABY4YU58_9MICO|nr:helix-turn-helix domain-containing protein [Ornithinimicrobium sp. HY1793]USQ80264.1 helix-turn-helix domain-containing protein [Ornithinimicrobium sp. HY1793]